MKFAILVLALVALCSASAPRILAAGSAGAQEPSDVNDQDNNVFTHAEGGIRFEKPAGWTHSVDGDTFTMLSPDHAVSIIITVAKEDTIKQAASEIDDALANVMTDIVTTNQGHQSDVNGMPTITVGGTGKIDGTPVTWAVDILGAKRPVFIITFGRQEGWEEHQGEFVAFAKSVRRA